MELHYCLPFPDRRFLQHNRPRVRNITLHNNTDRDTYITMALSTPQVVSVVISEIILYFTAYDVLCNCKWVSEWWLFKPSEHFFSYVTKRTTNTWSNNNNVCFFQTIALQVRHVAPLGHIIPTLNQPICFCPFSLMMFD